jgi:pyruvate formate lyase activating enzyme
LGLWLEVTTLLIPNLNDDPAEIRDLARFIRRDLGEETPWHVSRFFPRYKEQEIPPTDVESLRQVRKIGLDEGLLYVYTGNVAWDEGEKTYCPGCSNVLIDRVGYHTEKKTQDGGLCRRCGRRVNGVEI